MAGLLAARVLSDHFDRVLIIERDALPESPVERGGVPQGRHVHALLVQGQELLESFFPGLSAELTVAIPVTSRPAAGSSGLTAGSSPT